MGKWMVFGSWAVVALGCEVFMGVNEGCVGGGQEFELGVGVEKIFETLPN